MVARLAKHGGKKGCHLHGLAETHVIPEDAALLVHKELVEEPHALYLIVAKILRDGGGDDAARAVEGNIFVIATWRDAAQLGELGFLREVLQDEVGSNVYAVGRPGVEGLSEWMQAGQGKATCVDEHWTDFAEKFETGVFPERQSTH